MDNQQQQRLTDLGADTIAIFCERFRISPAFYFKQARLGRMPEAIRIGRKTLIPHAAIRTWLDKKIAEGA